ncbi:MAG: FAD-dependent oxidoreductase [Deltaproteobacteria bacterium]|nr:FAD-dependent oxidoreductase [Deltaproteobacteria bacterium]
MPLEPITATLEQVVDLTPTVKHFKIGFPRGNRPTFQAGQFCSIHIPEICGLDSKTGKPLRRAYSIASPPHEEGFVDLCIKRVEGGPATNWLWQQEEGASVLVSIPYGKFLMKEPVNYTPVFVATGTGIAPLRSMLFDLYYKKGLATGQEVWLIFGVRHDDEILYQDEWKKLEKDHKEFHFIPTVSRPKKWPGEVGYVQDKLKKFITDPMGKEIYICGLGAMVKAVQETALSIGFKKEQIHFERYD